MSAADRANLHARWIDQRAYESNKRIGVDRGAAAAEALNLLVPTRDAPPFALCRRANGLAHARWKQGFSAEAAAHARDAIRHAGDGGHVRLRAMALTMLGRILGGAEGAAYRARADDIVRALEDEALLLRFRVRERSHGT